MLILCVLGARPSSKASLIFTAIFTLAFRQQHLPFGRILAKQTLSGHKLRHSRVYRATQFLDSQLSWLVSMHKYMFAHLLDVAGSLPSSAISPLPLEPPLVHPRSAAAVRLRYRSRMKFRYCIPSFRDRVLWCQSAAAHLEVAHMRAECHSHFLNSISFAVITGNNRHVERTRRIYTPLRGLTNTSIRQVPNSSG